MSGPSDEFVAETRCYQTGIGRCARSGFEARVIVGTIVGWWDGIAGWNRFYQRWKREGDPRP